VFFLGEFTPANQAAPLKGGRVLNLIILFILLLLFLFCFSFHICLALPALLTPLVPFLVLRVSIKTFAFYVQSTWKTKNNFSLCLFRSKEHWAHLLLGLASYGSPQGIFYFWNNNYFISYFCSWPLFVRRALLVIFLLFTINNFLLFTFAFDLDQQATVAFLILVNKNKTAAFFVFLAAAPCFPCYHRLWFV
jgi:hypothetical protein